MTEADVRESFEASAFFSHIGFEIVHFQEGDVLLKLPITEQLLNANDTLHGGVHATMLDTIIGMTIRSITKTRCMTINLNVNYLSAIEDGEIFARGRVLQQGYRIVTAEGELFDKDENMLAKGVGTFKLVRD
ncbi:PaaI family thioesterase [Lentibacillus sp. Marseille-P4043]|uniref:PaaI family thioesterase n=1 Tax=Lentibacillus sp. Marseille-P4043 TaxID=2040293 RepID=UPI000D0B1B1C|nr:PaaI family thioesterase [Lentibacillus sp. Marseille-P4043]